MSDSGVEYFSASWLIALVAALAFIAIVLLLLIYQRKNHEHSFIKALVAKHSLAYVEDVVLSDGLEGYLFIDYLLLFGDKIVVLKVMDKHGYVFGAEKIDEWTCVRNNFTEKFSNPLKDVNLFAQEIKRTLGFEAVESYVLFGQQSRGEKGMPQGVLQKESFEITLESLSAGNHESASTKQVWDKLQVLTHQDKVKSAAETITA